MSPQLEPNFLDVLREHTAGDPMRQEVKWTHLTRREISERLAARGTPAGKRVVKPLEHRLFPHVTRACQGLVFHSVQIVKALMEKTCTRTGLQVTVDILDKVYDTGHTCAQGFKQNMKILFDDFLPQWNYRAVPPVT